MDSTKRHIAEIVEKLVAARIAGDLAEVVRRFCELAAVPGVHDAIGRDTLIGFVRLAESILRRPDTDPDLLEQFGAATQSLAASAPGFWAGQAFLFGSEGAVPTAALATKLVRAGDTVMAARLLGGFAPHELKLQPELWALYLQIERLSGRSMELVKTFGKDAELPLDCQWEVLLARVQCAETGPAQIVRAQAAGSELRHSSRMALVALWSWATSDRLGMLCPSERAIRDHARKEAGESAHLSLTLAIAGEIMTMAGAQDDAGREAATRLTVLLDRTGELPTIEHEALAFAATSRVAAKAGAPLLGEMAALRYRTISSRLSANRTEDAWLVSSAKTDLTVLGERDFRWLAQTAQQVTHLGGLTKTLVSSRLKRAVSGKAKSHELAEREAVAMAAELREAVRVTKGALLKVAQVMSFLDHVLPPVVAKELRSMEPEVTPLAGPLAAKIVETSLGRKIADVFSEWSTYPIAAASIGQVHRARLKSGELVAVKVQYPHLERYLTKQIKAINLLSGAMKPIFPTVDTRRIAAEVATSLMEEIDYAQEARHTTLAREFVQGIDGLSVARVYSELSSPRVLALEFLDGVHLRDFARTATQEERNRAAAKIYAAFVTPRVVHGFINKDPHPANFLFTQESVSYLDFGSSVLDPRLAAEWNVYLRLLSEGHRGRLLEFLVDVGFIRDPDQVDLDLIVRALESVSAMISRDRPARIDAAHVQRDFSHIQAISRMVDLPPGWFGILRAELGMSWVMVGLDAEVNFHRIYEEAVALAENKPKLIRLDSAS